ncbi:MAG: hypothetical protein K0Q87_5018 [Neobacillus sp.]|nr:hypothetical protein [Neobacillus sp.]
MKLLKYEYPAEYLELPEKRKIILKKWISVNLSPRKTINKSYSSYGLSDLLKRDINEYFSNDEFKGAMLDLGYRIEDPSAMNWYFGISKSSIDALWKRIYM